MAATSSSSMALKAYPVRLRALAGLQSRHLYRSEDEELNAER